MTAHIHAELFLAVANGDIDQWECQRGCDPWCQAAPWLSSIADRPERWTVRRKAPATKTVHYLCWESNTGNLTHVRSDKPIHTYGWTRIPSLDKTAEVPV